MPQTDKLPALPPLEAVLADQHDRWYHGDHVLAEEYFGRFPGLRADRQAAIELIYGEYSLRRALGREAAPDDFLGRFPEYAPELTRQFEVEQALGMDSLWNEDPPSTGTDSTGDPSAKTSSAAALVQSWLRRTDSTGSIRTSASAPELSHAELSRRLRRRLWLLEQSASWCASATSRSRLFDIQHTELDELPEQIGRFPIRRRLGAGGFGAVYEAFDPEHDETLALKTLRHPRPSAIEQFKREFRSLAQISHPNLALLHELFAEDGQWFFTMELLEGRTFLDHFRAQPPATRFTALRSSLRQLASGLGYLHATGKLHCDLKPSNVLVTAGDRVVILDFGLVADVQLPDDQEPAALPFGGTPAYMSLEQLLGLPLTPASDCFSVGVMLYEALTGRRPLQENDVGVPQVHTILELLEGTGPDWPPRLPDAVPADLARLCQDLLRLEPDKRPTTGDVTTLSGTSEEQSFPPPPPRPIGHDFIGRKTQLDELEDVVFSAQSDAPSTAVLLGVSGIGKSALLHEFCDRLEERGDVLVLRSRCRQRESVPFKSLDGLVDGLAAWLARQPRETLPGLGERELAALARAFPAFARSRLVDGETLKQVSAADPSQRQLIAFESFRQLLGAARAVGHVVLAIDDLQWDDVDSAALVGYVLGHPTPPGVTVVGACRSDEADESNLLARLRSPRSDWPHREIGVPPLSTEEAVQLSSGLLQQERISRAWPNYKRSFDAAHPISHICCRHLRARAALAALRTGPNDRRLLRVARRDARILEHEHRGWANPLGRLIQAAVAKRTGREKEAVGLLDTAIREFDEWEMHLYSAAARIRLGELIGGDNGRELIDAGTTFMTDQGVVAPEPMTQMLASGYD